MDWQAGFVISLSFGTAAVLAFLLALATAGLHPMQTWRLPAAAGALVANQLASWMVQQFAGLNPFAMTVVDGALAALALAVALPRLKPWTTAFGLFAGAQLGASLAHCFDGADDEAYLLYVWATDLTFAALLAVVVAQCLAALCRRRRRRAIQFRPA